MFEVKGNKNIDTIICESVLRTNAHMNGFACWSEVQVDKGRIDFVIGKSGEDDLGRMYMNTASGIELKVSWTDFNSGNGRHVFSYHYNYFLVPEELVYKVQRFIDKNEEYSHVGLLVVTDEYTIEIIRNAKFLPFGDRFDSRLKQHETDKYVSDGITELLATIGYECEIQCHDMINNCDFTYRGHFETAIESEYAPFVNKWSEVEQNNIKEIEK